MPCLYGFELVVYPKPTSGIDNLVLLERAGCRAFGHKAFAEKQVFGAAALAFSCGITTEDQSTPAKILYWVCVNSTAFFNFVRATRIKGVIFVFIYTNDDHPGVSVKLESDRIPRNSKMIVIGKGYEQIHFFIGKECILILCAG